MKERFTTKRIIGIFIFLVLFGVWTWLVVSKSAFIAGFDKAVQDFAFSLRQDWLTKIVVPFSYSGNWQAQLIICLLVLIIPKTRFCYGLPLACSSLVSVGFYQAVKYMVCRARPDKALHLLIQDGYSYVSGHSQTSIITWGIMLLLLEYYFAKNGASLPLYDKLPYFKNHPQPAKSFPHSKKQLNIWRIGLIAYIFLMGLSRIYVGVHWPSDVIGGWLLGMVVILLLDGIAIGGLCKNKVMLLDE